MFVPVIVAQVLKETLRIYPTAPGTSRDIEEDMTIDGVRIPAGVNCMVSPLLLNVLHWNKNMNQCKTKDTIKSQQAMMVNLWLHLNL